MKIIAVTIGVFLLVSMSGCAFAYSEATEFSLNKRKGSDDITLLADNYNCNFLCKERVIVEFSSNVRANAGKGHYEYFLSCESSGKYSLILYPKEGTKTWFAKGETLQEIQDGLFSETKGGN